MIISPIYAYDSLNNKGSDVRNITLNNTMTMKKIGGDSYELVVSVDKAFLEDSNTQYPVTVDPSVVINSSNIESSMIFQDNPDGNIFWSSMMFVGKHNIEDYGWTEMYIRLKDLKNYLYISPRLIENVTYNMYEWSGHQFPARIELYDLASKNWTENGITWNNKPNTYGKAISYVDYPPSETWSKFDITSLFKKWLSNELGEGGFSKDYGFCLKATKDNEHSRYYCSSIDTNKPPTISINYREDTSVTNDMYFIRNQETGSYLQATINDNNVTSFEFLGNNNQIWNVSVNANGKYKLQNAMKLSNSVGRNVLDTDTTSENSNADLWNDTNLMYNTFRIVQNADKSYRIMSMYGNNYRALTEETTINQGIRNCCFKTFQKNNNSQKWILEKVYEANVNNYYDYAFAVRYNKAGDPNVGINLTNSIANKHFMNVFHLAICNNTPLKIASAADECKIKRRLVIDQSTINELCPGGKYHEPACTGWLQSYPQFIEKYPGNDRCVSILWTGNKLEINRSFAWYDNGIMLQELMSNDSKFYYNRVNTITHELSHQFGAPDHYHEILEDGICRGGVYCSVCGINSRPGYCIMNDGWMSDIVTRKSDTIWCDECKNEIRNHLKEHH